MKKMNVLVKGSLALALGLSSMFLAEKAEALPANVAYATSQDETDLASAKTALEAKKSIFEDKLKFAEDFKKTRAYKETSAENKAKFDSDVAKVEVGLNTVNKAIAFGKTKDDYEKADKEAEGAMNTLIDVLNDIYRDDALISKILRANIAIGVNKEEYIPKRYKKEYKEASEALQREYEKIWLENKVYKEEELTKVLERYQNVVEKINKANSSNEVQQVKDAIAQLQKKVDGIEYLKKNTPNTAKKYEKIIKEALDQANKAIKDAQAWLANHDK